MVRLALLSGSISFFLAVALGAFGAHALEPTLVINERSDVYETASRYHFYHAIALLLVGTLASGRYQFKSLRPVCYLFIIGTVVFSGSLYLLAISNAGVWGAITPIGGLLLLLAWLLLARDIVLNIR